MINCAGHKTSFGEIKFCDGWVSILMGGWSSWYNTHCMSEWQPQRWAPPFEMATLREPIWLVLVLSFILVVSAQSEYTFIFYFITQILSMIQTCRELKWRYIFGPWSVACLINCSLPSLSWILILLLAKPPCIAVMQIWIHTHIISGIYIPVGHLKITLATEDLPHLFSNIQQLFSTSAKFYSSLLETLLCNIILTNDSACSHQPNKATSMQFELNFPPVWLLIVIYILQNPEFFLNQTLPLLLPINSAPTLCLYVTWIWKAVSLTGHNWYLFPERILINCPFDSRNSCPDVMNRTGTTLTWDPYEGTTPSVGTGPTGGTNDKYYIYVETSGKNLNDKAEYVVHGGCQWLHPQWPLLLFPFQAGQHQQPGCHRGHLY